MSTTPSKSAVLFSLGAVYMIWGSTYVTMRIGLEGFPPFVMGGIRYLLAGASMYAFLRLRGAPRPSRKEWAHSAVVGFLMLLVGNDFVAVAEQYVASSLAAVMVGSMPLYAALFSGLFGKWPGRWEWMGLGLGLTGLVVLNLDGDLRANLLGAVALVVAPICWALGSVLSRRLTLPKGPMGSAAQMLTGSLLISLVGAFQVPQMHHAPSLRSILAVLFLVVFGSIIAFSAYQYLLGAVRPALATSYAYVNPLIALLLGLTIGGEHITRSSAVGAGMIVLAVVLVAVGGTLRSRAPAVAPANSISPKQAA